MRYPNHRPSVRVIAQLTDCFIVVTANKREPDMEAKQKYENKQSACITYILKKHIFKSFGAEVDKSRRNGLSAEIDYSRPRGGECCGLYSLPTEVAYALHT